MEKTYVFRLSAKNTRHLRVERAAICEERAGTMGI